MAETKSYPKKKPTALKRDIQNEKKRLSNKSFKSKIRSAFKKLETLVQSKSSEMNEQLNLVYSLMDKGVKKGVLKGNKAARHKAQAVKMVAAAS